jgi:hypothetical protein
MKYQFNFFGLLLILFLLIFFSSASIETYQESETNPSENQDPQLSSAQAFSNNTTGNTTTPVNVTGPEGMFRPPLQNKTDFKAGSNIPIKFYYTRNGTFVVDNNVSVVIYDSSNNTVETFYIAKNPSMGIAVQDPTQYHVNWKTPKGAPGKYIIAAFFSDGFSIGKQINLFDKGSGSSTNTSTPTPPAPPSYNVTVTAGFQPPLENKTDFKAGSTIPIKFNYTRNGTFVVDYNVTVTVYDTSNNTIASFVVADNPSQGIAIQNMTQYHVNWKTPKKAPGDYYILVSFSDGLKFYNKITLF